MSEKKAKDVAKEKIQEVTSLKSLLKEYPVIGLANLENLPSPQLQKMRSQLKGKATIKMSKKRLIKIAIDNTDKKDLGILKEKLRGMPALIFTKDDPFRLFKTLAKSKSSALIKPGQKAPKDILIPAGPTNFAPGPIISELGSIGLKTAIEGGKISIKDEKVVAKEGEIVNEKISGVLAKLGIEPMEIGINLVCVYENGLVYDKEVLSIDEADCIKNIKTAHIEGINLAVKIGYTTEETIKILLLKADKEANVILNKPSFSTFNKPGHSKKNVKLSNTINLDNPKEENHNLSAQKLIDNAEGETKEEKEQREIKEVEELTKKIMDVKIKNK